MKIISTNKNLPFDFSRWDMSRITDIYAGMNVVMGITYDDTVEYATIGLPLSDVSRWKDVRSIAVSNWTPGAVIAVTRDGRCLVSKDGLSDISGRKNIIDSVSQWHSITQVCASDGFFALDVFGKVHIAPFGNTNEYNSAKEWENIVRIAVGNQSSLFGITKDGRVLCAGGNCLSGPYGNMQEQLDKFYDVVDICAAGAECNRVFIAFKDGTVSDLFGSKLDIKHSGKAGVFISNFAVTAIKTANKKTAFYPYFFPDKKNLDTLRRPSRSVAVGHINNSTPFVLSLTEKRSFLGLRF